MTVRHEEFIRRFEIHILPKRFVKIRHTGFLRNRHKMDRINCIRASIGLGELSPQKPKYVAIRMLEKYGIDIAKCTCCDTGRMEIIFDTRAKRIEK
jgi:hypothetical protein